MTYPEQVVYDHLIELGFNPIHNWHLVTSEFNRYVDFFIEDKNLIIEVDGEHWHQDKLLDERKDSDAALHGFQTLRLKAKDNLIKSLNEFFKII